jgi:hypothetical protein
MLPTLSYIQRTVIHAALLMLLSLAQTCSTWLHKLQPMIAVVTLCVGERRIVESCNSLVQAACIVAVLPGWPT